eukprot:354903-Chlamydomonas_euryale.AAC.25
MPALGLAGYLPQHRLPPSQLFPIHLCTQTTLSTNIVQCNKYPLSTCASPMEVCESARGDALALAPRGHCV